MSGKLIVDSMLRLAEEQAGGLPAAAGLDRGLSRAVTVPGDLVLTLGAGDVHRVGERFLAVV